MNQASVSSDGKVRGGVEAGKMPGMSNTAKLVTKPDPMARPSSQKTTMTCPGTR